SLGLQGDGAPVAIAKKEGLADTLARMRDRIKPVARALSEIANREEKQGGEAEVRQGVLLELRSRGGHAAKFTSSWCLPRGSAGRRWRPCIHDCPRRCTRAACSPPCAGRHSRC